MAQQHDIWTIEELLWTGGTDTYRTRLAPGCMMAFHGLGVLQGEEILESLKDAPRWQSVEMTARHTSETDGIVVISYVATGYRDGDAPHRVLCTSTWRRTGNGWRLVQHQQAPEATAEG